jgi:hypothetical protein
MNELSDGMEEGRINLAERRRVLNRRGLHHIVPASTTSAWGESGSRPASHAFPKRISEKRANINTSAQADWPAFQCLTIALS